MLRKVLLIIICTLLSILMTSGYSKNHISRHADILTCKNLTNCHLIAENYKLTHMNNNNNSPQLISSPTNIKFRSKRAAMALERRSYYNSGYGIGGGSPAFYPAFDPLSVLASLAFLAFLLQSFASLFDRSRSIIPAIVTSRDSSPDLVRLIMQALDEYEMLNNDILLEKDNERKKLS